MVAQSRDPLLGIRRSSVRFVRSIVYSRLVGNPIHFPGLAAILREGLLKVRPIRVGFRPNESHQDTSAIRARRFRVEKLAASIAKFRI
jgi:hypothetical protein